MKKVSHLLVDLDGTLVDGGETLRVRLEFLFRLLRSWQSYGRFTQHFQAFRQMRIAAESSALHGTNEERMVKAFAGVYKVSEADARRRLSDSIREVFPAISHHFYPVPGAVKFIDWAKNHFPLVLATNPVWNPEEVELRVNWAGLDLATFQSFTHAKRMHACKPTVEYYEELLAQEKLDPSQCLLIGNDYQNDLPATKVGIRVFLIDESTDCLKSIYRPILKGGLAWKGTYTGLKSLLEIELSR